MNDHIYQKVSDPLEKKGEIKYLLSMGGKATDVAENYEKAAGIKRKEAEAGR